jgi:hypothetical protein
MARLQTPRWRFAAVLVTAAALVALLVAASRLRSEPAGPEPVAAIESALAPR